MNYFLINKAIDFLRGYGEGAAYNFNKVVMRPGETKASFFSRVLDSKLEGTVWHRMVADICKSGAVVIRFYIYSTDNDSITVMGDNMSISGFIKNPSISIDEKKKILKPLLRKRFVNCDDILLFDVKGRYMFYLCEMYSRDNTEPYVGDVEVYFPRKTWNDFLPGLYSEAIEKTDFPERFLAVFQTVYDDLDQKIKDSPMLLDPKIADRAMLEELAGWFGLRNLYLWSDEKLRILVSRAGELARESGTIKGIGDVLEIYLGERPEIIECFKVAESGSAEDQLEYGTDKYKYIVNVKDKYLKTTKDYNALLYVIEGFSPAHMSIRIRPVIEHGTTGGNAYLGINTGLDSGDRGVLR